jgi:hypothetical protein
MGTIKLCKDCRFLSYGDLSDVAARMAASADHSGLLASVVECHHPSARKKAPIDLVTGVIKETWESCRNHRVAGYRDTDQNCGPHGRWFEPKDGPQPPEPVGFVDGDPPPRTGGAMAKQE